MGRLIDAIQLKIAIAYSNIIEDGKTLEQIIDEQPTIEPERCQLTDDDKEVIRIHLNAFKEKLCNQYRWIEAQEYEELIDRLMNLQPERKGKWIGKHESGYCSHPDSITYRCSECGYSIYTVYGIGMPTSKFCPNCGCQMEG